ncbi:MAG: DNA topoisomerase (ATP-hydrolyzing) subunit B [bacterium]|nr:DNA topoisomerase (ATP-hydrolyzing) subunit B [bacterium]
MAAVDTQKVHYDAEQIQVLKGLDAVRKRPSMYIGSTGVRGLHHLVYEVVDNSIDEALAGFCDKIDVFIHSDNSISVIDNGRGFPVDIHPEMGIPGVEVAMTVLHAGGKFGSGGYKVSGGLHGVGVSVVNALSEWLQVEVSRNGKLYRQRYERGVTVSKLEEIGKSAHTGTKVSFKPDAEIFDKTEYSFDTLSQRLRELAFLNKGVRISLTDEREGGEEVVFEYKGGIASFIEYLNKNKIGLHKVVHFEDNRDNTDVEVGLQYNDSYMENILTFANNINTAEGGTHLSGFKTAMTRVINDYARKNNILKEKDSNLSGDDIREGLTAVISVKLLNPQFEGQTKTKLGNGEISGLVNTIVGEKLSEFLEQQPAVAKRIIEKALTASRARDAARKASELIKRKSVLEHSTLPGKLADCSEKDPTKCELYIVEGDSAGGSAKQGRDRRYQAILPLRGKILNVEKARLDKMLANEEIRSMITALGTGLAMETTSEDEDNDGYNLSKLRYHRIIIMTDADVDGAHIRTLLLTFFYRYMRPLVNNGHIYIAQPPLYQVKSGKEKAYAYDDKELKEVLKNFPRKKYSLQRYKGLGEMNPEQLWETTMDAERRIILQVTLEDAFEADEVFSTLMGDKVEPRRDFITRNARYVRNLDV